MNDIVEKVIVITGASSGIGKACAIRFAKENVAIVIAARNKENLQESGNEIRKITSHVLEVVCDVA